MSCCWPLGEPGTPSFRFCDAEASPGKPYCGDHAAVAYVKVRDRREEAA
jgi:GcrA cell cycle regulator